jgi:DNA-binding NarL/FixJ family response regulator
LARTLADLGQRDLARREAAAAVRVLDRAGAGGLSKQAQMVLADLNEQRAGLLTRRQLEVLGLIAQGMRDGDIATALP